MHMSVIPYSQGQELHNSISIEVLSPGPLPKFSFFGQNFFKNQVYKTPAPFLTSFFCSRRSSSPFFCKFTFNFSVALIGNFKQRTIPTVMFFYSHKDLFSRTNHLLYFLQVTTFQAVTVRNRSATLLDFTKVIYYIGLGLT